MKVLFDFDDILIEPASFSSISSRKSLSVKDENGYLPLFTAPMDTVISPENAHFFKNVGIKPVLPRIANPTQDYVSTEYFLSYSLDDFNKIFLTEKLNIDKPIYVLIDIANGHMLNLYDSSMLAKKIYGDKMILMVGNIANPITFESYCDIGVDYVRVGIGNGNGCLTAQQLGVSYPMASLIEECAVHSTGNTKIVADGGFKKYSDVIKALGIGADYVMLGSILNKALESAGETRNTDNILINQYHDEAKEFFSYGGKLTKVFRGMSTKEVQKAWGKEILTTSEGVVRTQDVEYTLQGWVENFEDYLKSAMSYCNKETLQQFIGGVKYNQITNNAFNRFNK